MATLSNSVRTRKQAGARPRPSLVDEAWDLYKLAQAYGDEATMQIAMRDMEIAREIERDPAEEIVMPLESYGLPGCRYTVEEHHEIACQGVNARFSRTRTRWSYDRASAVDYPGTLSTAEYAAIKGVTMQTVRAWIKSGALRAIRTADGCGNQWRIPVEEDAA